MKTFCYSSFTYINLDLLLIIAIGYIDFIGEKYDERVIVMHLIEQSKRIQKSR
jgi:hypothetical protein